MASASTRSSSSAVELSSDVNTTIEKLQELRNDLELNKAALFLNEFHASAPSIITALEELDAVRLKAHDKLEVESITASVLRHTLNTYSMRLKEEAANTVESARASNQALLKQLKDKVDHMNHDSTELVGRHEMFEQHNERIQYELKETNNRHGGQAKRLNDKISERASLQILLNDTTDQLLTTNKLIQSLKDEKHSLDMTLATRKDEFDNGRDNLIKTMDETKIELNQQHTENYQLKKEVQELRDEVTRASFTIHKTIQDISETEQTIESLLLIEEELKAVIVKTERENIAIEDMSKSIAGDIIELEKEFKQKKKKKEATIRLLTNEVQQTKLKNESLKATKKDAYKVLKEAKDKKDSQSTSLADIKRSVDSSKKLLSSESEAGVRLSSEKEEIEYCLISLRETHKVTVQLLKEEMLKLKEKLSKEKKIRGTVEDSYNTLQGTIQEQLSSHCLMMTSLTDDMNEAELKENKMIALSEQLETEILTYDQNITALGQELDCISSRLKFVNNDLEEKITETENCIAELKEDNYEHSESLLLLEPDIASLKSNYAILSEKYEQMKKDMIALKNRKSSLQDTCTRLERDLGKMSIPQDKLRLQTLSCRAYTRQWLASQKRIVEGIEERVKEGEMKLYNISKQNIRFTKAIEVLHEECKKMKSIRTKSSMMESSMIKRLTDIKALLEGKWTENQQLAEHYSDLDRITVNGLEECELEWKERVKWIREVTLQFEKEMEQFSTFIQTLSKSVTAKS